MCVFFNQLRKKYYSKRFFLLLIQKKKNKKSCKKENGWATHTTAPNQPENDKRTKEPFGMDQMNNFAHQENKGDHKGLLTKAKQ